MVRNNTKSAYNSLDDRRGRVKSLSPVLLENGAQSTAQHFEDAVGSRGVQAPSLAVVALAVKLSKKFSYLKNVADKAQGVAAIDEKEMSVDEVVSSASGVFLVSTVNSAIRRYIAPALKEVSIDYKLPMLDSGTIIKYSPLLALGISSLAKQYSFALTLGVVTSHVLFYELPEDFSDVMQLGLKVGTLFVLPRIASRLPHVDSSYISKIKGSISPEVINSGTLALTFLIDGDDDKRKGGYEVLNNVIADNSDPLSLGILTFSGLTQILGVAAMPAMAASIGVAATADYGWTAYNQGTLFTMPSSMQSFFTRDSITAMIQEVDNSDSLLLGILTFSGLTQILGVAAMPAMAASIGGAAMTDYGWAAYNQGTLFTMPSSMQSFFTRDSITAMIQEVDNSDSLLLGILTFSGLTQILGVAAMPAMAASIGGVAMTDYGWAAYNQNTLFTIPSSMQSFFTNSITAAITESCYDLFVLGKILDLYTEQ